ncbi:MAG TPA: hypothetical protein VFG69_12325 [Nannocystaceae bacterium]|nr:hypothetical protein [Nannocystaceae bacterium]
MATAVPDVSTLLAAAAWTEPRSPQATPAAWLELRDTASAIRLAVQILRGPYAMIGDGEMQARAREVLLSLEQSTRRLCDLVATVQPPANDAGPAASAPVVVAPERPQPSAPSLLASARARSTAAPSTPEPRTPSATLSAVRPAAPARSRAATGPRTLDVAELLARLELVVATRAVAPLDLTVAAPPSIALAVDGAELLRTLVLMIEDVAPADGPVDVRAFLDPTEDLGDALDVVFEVRASASTTPPVASAALRAAVDGLRGQLHVRRTHNGAALVMRLPSGR